MKLQLPLLLPTPSSLPLLPPLPWDTRPTALFFLLLVNLLNLKMARIKTFILINFHLINNKSWSHSTVKKNLPVVYMLMSLWENLITKQQELCETFLCHHLYYCFSIHSVEHDVQVLYWRRAYSYLGISERLQMQN